MFYCKIPAAVPAPQAFLRCPSLILLWRDTCFFPSHTPPHTHTHFQWSRWTWSSSSLFGAYFWNLKFISFLWEGQRCSVLKAYKDKYRVWCVWGRGGKHLFFRHSRNAGGNRAQNTMIKYETLTKTNSPFWAIFLE